MYFRTPHTIKLLSTDLFNPFGTSVWICLALAALIIGAALKFMLLWENKLKQIKAEENLSLALLLGISLGAFCQQGTALAPKLTSGRCVYIFLFLSSIIIYNYYTSVLVSTLVGSPMKTNIKNVDDLSDSELKIGFEDIPYMRGYLNVTEFNVSFAI